MFCPNCRNQVVDGAEFCPNCGANIKEIQSQIQKPMYNQPQNNYQQPMNNQNNSSNKKSILLPVIIVIVLAIVAVFGASKLMKKDTSINNNDTNNQQVQENDDTSNNTQTNNNSGDSTGTVDPNTNLTYDKDGAFLMSIEDVFTITGRGTVVTGRVERGTIKLNDEVQIIGLNHEIITTTVTGIEMFRKSLDYAEAGDNAGLLLKDVSREDVERGQVVAKPNSIRAATRFDADVYVLTKEEGGRHTPFFNNYRPQFYFKTTDITGVITLPSDIEMVNPGENVKMTVELTSNIAMEIGTTFSIREGGRTIGSGTVTKVY